LRCYGPPLAVDGIVGTRVINLGRLAATGFSRSLQTPGTAETQGPLLLQIDPCHNHARQTCRDGTEPVGDVLYRGATKPQVFEHDSQEVATDRGGHYQPQVFRQGDSPLDAWATTDEKTAGMDERRKQRRPRPDEEECGERSPDRRYEEGTNELSHRLLLFYIPFWDTTVVTANLRAQWDVGTPAERLVTVGFWFCYDVLATMPA
jgi:hypothetical protein